RSGCGFSGSARGLDGVAKQRDACGLVTVAEKPRHVFCASPVTASTKSTIFSSAGDVFTSPVVPTDPGVEEGVPVPRSENRFVPVAQLSTSRIKKPPIPRPAMPPPDRPRLSSMLPRSPGVQRISLLPVSRARTAPPLRLSRSSGHSLGSLQRDEDVLALRGARVHLQRGGTARRRAVGASSLSESRADRASAQGPPRGTDRQRSRRRHLQRRRHRVIRE